MAGFRILRSDLGPHDRGVTTLTTSAFSNGDTLESSALTPDTFAALFQPVIARILGFDTDANPAGSFAAVRIGWQQEGQPSWGIGDDVCVLMATPDNDPYSRVRDSLYEPNDAESLTSAMSFTQVWTLHATLYGPNCQDHARLIVSAMSLDWVHDDLAAADIYALADWTRPTYVPEQHDGQWWKRSDLEMKFNELVNESIVVPSAAGVDVTLVKDTGLTAGIHIRN